MPVSISGTNGVTFPDSSLQAAAASPYVLKNRIINGAMVIDQRNAGASVTPTANGTYVSIDRWQPLLSQASKYSLQQNAGAVTTPIGFTNYLGATSLSAYTVLTGDYFILAQNIEGFNTADLQWGTANAQTITLSFWVRSSLTGTFGGAIQNSAENRSYPFSYTISSANTWEQKSITIAGDTSGTWIGATNGVGIRVRFGLGVGATYSGTAGAWAAATYFSATGATSVVGTNGATFYITGVQLEVGSSATPFERRMYGQELANCQRYYYKVLPTINGRFGTGYNKTTTASAVVTFFPVSMRIAPTALEQTGTAADYGVGNLNTGTVCNAVPTFSISNQSSAESTFNTSATLTGGQGSLGYAVTSTSYLAWSAEL
jgi:hypothetical protein